MLVASLLASGCGATKATSPGPAVRGAVEFTGTLTAIENSMPIDGDYVAVIVVSPGETRVAYVEARLQVLPDQLPFSSDVQLIDLVVGDRVRIRGVPQGTRVRMVRLDRLAH